MNVWSLPMITVVATGAFVVGAHAMTVVLGWRVGNPGTPAVLAMGLGPTLFRLHFHMLSFEIRAVPLLVCRVANEMPAPARRRVALLTGAAWAVLGLLFFAWALLYPWSPPPGAPAAPDSRTVIGIVPGSQAAAAAVTAGARLEPIDASSAPDDLELVRRTKRARGTPVWTVIDARGPRQLTFRPGEAVGLWYEAAPPLPSGSRPKRITRALARSVILTAQLFPGIDLTPTFAWFRKTPAGLYLNIVLVGLCFSFAMGHVLAAALDWQWSFRGLVGMALAILVINPCVTSGVGLALSELHQFPLTVLV
jgi:hypothetical protein